MTAPLCFVLMPLGKRPTASGQVIDFDAVYQLVIQPAMAAAGLDPFRTGQDKSGDFLHTSVYEGLALCEYAVADLTDANANDFFALGLRHAVRAHSTTLIYAEGLGRLPVDVKGLRGLSYRIGADGKPADPANAVAALASKLRDALDRARDIDRTVVQLLEHFPDIQRLKTDVFREQVRYSEPLKARLAAARKLGRKSGPEALRAIEADIDRVADANAGVMVDLMLSYRAVESWQDMIALIERMPAPLAATVLVQEQLGLALNRAGHSDRAEQTLTHVIARRGPSSETCALLGRVYKDRYQAALKTGKAALARAELDKAIDAYLRGFNTDIRDAYPGINAVTLMELRDPPDERRLALLPVVAYAVSMRIEAGKPDYWDFATLLELAVLGKDRDRAASNLTRASAAAREAWEPRATLNNLRLIGVARAQRGESVDWTSEMETALEERAREIEAGKT